ncbi:enoyl-CoA hydratase [Rhodococcus sp. SGAir0479]|uniref:enoyl-CoA hydratase n=1 Tax=Rhodococcus sp. SGAir0479 TaxID=2567884 RepID=UPI0010CD1C8B|nr:enoyl-CoA hydratase [Rhodococcus sp. SGAir0479]QCQ94104.1 enoyl-CoA hydratase [Rhodococcus sp. SGAir0479]
MMRRGRKALVALDSGDWCFARVVGRRRVEPGVRVQLQVGGTGSKLPTFAITDTGAGDGFAL